MVYQFHNVWKLSFLWYVVNGLIQIVETANLFMIIGMAGNSTETVIFPNRWRIVLAIILSDSAKTSWDATQCASTIS